MTPAVPTPPPTDGMIRAFHAPVPPQDVPRFELMAGDLRDWLSHSRHFAGIDTIRLWSQPAEVARSFEAVVDCLIEAGVEPGWDVGDDFPIERVQAWCAMNRPGVLIDGLSHAMGVEWCAVRGTSFERPERDIHGALMPRPPTGPSRGDEAVEEWSAKPFKDLTPEEQVAERAEQAEIRRRDVVENSRFRPLTATEMRQRPQARELIRGVLPAVGIAAIFGSTMSAKSFLALDLLDAVSSGRPDWFGHKIAGQGACTYVALEGGSGIGRRAKALNCESIHFVIPGAFDLRSAADRSELVEVLKARGLTNGILAVDTLAQSTPGMDENSGRDMGEVIAALNELQAAVGGLVLVIAHTGKDQTKGLRGHSSLVASLDGAIEVRRDGDRREWTVAKAKDDADGASHAFTLDVVQVGQDEDGEPVTSCTIQPETQSAKPVRRTLPPKSGNQKIVWEALTEILRFAPAPAIAPEGLPAGRACVLLEAAVEAIRTRLVCDSKRQTERTQSAVTGLINRGLLVHRNGWIWHA